MANETPFYVGYRPLPAPLKRVVLLIAAVWFLALLGLAAVLAARQQDPGPGVREAGETRAIEGHLEVLPYPVLHVDDPDSPTGKRSVILVSPFKFGASERAAPFADRHVKVEGRFIRREGRAIFELAAGEVISRTTTSAPAPEREPLGSVSLVGEITDSKCFMGMMKPGFGKTHRACATRCIAGGIPPILVTRDEAGKETVIVLADAEGGPVNEVVLPYVAEPVEVTGSLELRGDLPVLKIAPDGILRK